MSLDVTRNRLLRPALSFFSSLRLTVVCLGVSMVLVFFSTLAQVKLGIWEAMERYFSTWFVWGTVPGTELSLPWLPGGYLVGGVLILNLLCAHQKRFRLKWNKMGLFLVHIGILMLLGGGFVTHWLSHEGQLRFDEGEEKHFYESFLDRELVVIEQLPGNRIQETRFDSDMLKTGAVLEGMYLPFSLRIDTFYPNTRLTLNRAMGPAPASPVNRGFGTQVNAEKTPRTFKPNEQNLLTAFVTPVYNERDIGTWLVTNAVPDPQWFEVENRRFALVLRRTRYYMPFSLTLMDFTHDRYPGTQIPKNFSSDVRIRDRHAAEDREVLIYMNHPLRYGGKTFFQQGFDNNDTTSILQVVQNPGWLLPYISCAFVSIGLLWHFIMHLLKHLNKRKLAA